MKICKDCKKLLPISDFSYRDAKHRYRRSWCKECSAIRRQKQRIKRKKINPEKEKLKYRKFHLKTNFNLTLDDYDKLFQQQNGICAVCKNPEIAKNQFGNKRLAVDHNHLTGKIRGLLCSKCNGGLGNFDDNIDLLLNAIEYLRKTAT